MLSILTNFGCHWGCRYCVYRENGINIKATDCDTFAWGELEKELARRKGELISISGGGDPLYNYQNNAHGIKDFYIKLFKLLDKYNCRLELHTSILIDCFPYDKCERVVFHLTTPTQISLVNRRMFNLSDYVRAVFVVQDYYTKCLVSEIVRCVNDKDNAFNELSFRQMIGSKGETKCYLHEYLKDGHMGDWYYIEQCDYNEYFVGDHIESEYLKIG